jgi:hypothetical protein
MCVFCLCDLRSILLLFASEKCYAYGTGDNTETTVLF